MAETTTAADALVLPPCHLDMSNTNANIASNSSHNNHTNPTTISTTTTTNTTNSSSAITTTNTSTTSTATSPSTTHHAQTVAVNTVRNKTAEADAGAEPAELPPFSFKKKPIDQYSLLKNRCSVDSNNSNSSNSTSQSMETIFHSNISSILPALVRKKDSAASIENDNAKVRGPLYKDIDYDEQIRFPRMNNMNYYTYTKKGTATISARNNTSFSDGTGDSTSSQESDKDKTEIDNVKDSEVRDGTITEITSSNDAISTESDRSNTASSNNDRNSNSNNNKEVNDSSSNNYMPATFDLSQPLRRFSLPMSKNDSSNTRDSLQSMHAAPFSENVIHDTEPEDENVQLLKEYTSNNYIYQRDWEQQKLKNTISNFINPEEQTCPEDPTTKQHPYYYPKSGTRIKNQTSFPSINRSKSKADQSASSSGNTSPTSTDPNSSVGPLPSTNSAASGLNQVYQWKKPLITPAVLRPMQSNNGLNTDIVVETSLPTTNSTYTISSPTVVQEETMQNLSSLDPDNMSVDSVKQTSNDKKLFCYEPTRIHWKINSFSNHCMQCFKSFSNSIFSLVLLYLDEKIGKDGLDIKNHSRRRHHCRFCGLIYCDDCLMQNDADEANKYSTSRFGLITRDGGNGIIVDKGARFVVPIYRNLSTTNSSSSSTISNVSMDSAASASSQVSFITNPENYKLFKICKKCGETYKSLVVDINRTADAAAKNSSAPVSSRYNCELEVLQKFPFIYVENPYVARVKEEMARMEQTQKTSVVVYKHFAATKPTLNDSFGTNGRNNSVNEVPSDWTWSSF
ncbi:hypothetical protein G9P44_001341 [Scheffersomyces stipitis]|nr:hypothetical protein G9P44_001341 [Scheffersomyces stipitis]